MSTAADFDLGPLTWVKSEIDQALEKSLASLRKYAANPGDSKQIKFSQTHFHQAHGALQIVGLDGVTRLSEELDGLLGDIAKAEGAAPTPDQLAAAERAFSGITAYLDQLLGGEPNQPLRLFAVYGDVLKVRGRDGADPVDLYYPDLLQRPPRREKPPVELAPADAAAYYRDQRGRYQRGLLKLIKKDASGVEDMRAAVAAVEAAQSNPASRAFWWVALGFFDALFAKAITDAPLITRLANRVEQQLKRLMEGSATVAERLMREALFAVARARPATEHVRNVQEVFRLAGTVPATFELKGEGAPQNPSLKALRELVGNAKMAWNKVASGHQPSLANFREFVTQMRARAGELKQQNLVLLAHDIIAITGWIGEATEKASDNVAMEVATALLLVENAAENHANLGDEFAQQAGLMHQRLQAIVKGETLQDAAPVPVLDEMSRRAQERLLMAQVVSEIQASLRAIEQALDAFFRDAAKRAELAALDKPVRQVLGALTMLNEDRAAAALSTCAVEIQRFAKGDYVAAQGDFERVAGTLSGLGFYVDALQHGKADFDQFMKPISAKKAEAPEEAGAGSAPAKTVEAELEQGKKALSALVEEWKKHPADEQLKVELKARAASLQKDAGLVADAKTEAQAADILKLLEAADAKPFDPQVSQVLTQIQPAPAAPSVQAQKLMAASDETIDAELLSVYLEEAGEVLVTIAENLEQAREVPQNMEVLRTIRRGFHTLKGSGRMVGLTRLGEAAWAVEQVMNRWLEEERAGTPDLFTLVAAARAFFEGAVASLKAGGASPDESQVVAMAQKVKAGEPLGEVQLETAAPAPVAAPAPAAPAATREAALEFPAIDIAAIAPPGAPETIAAPAAPLELAPALLEPAATIELAPAAPAPAEPEEATIDVGGIALSPALYGIFLDETRSHLAHLGAGKARLAEGEPVTEDVERSAHTLAGIAGTVKFTAMRELAHGLEEMLERFVGKPADTAARSLIGAAIDALGGMLAAAEARTLPQPAGDLIARLSAAAPGAAPAPAAPAAPTADSLDFLLPGADTVTPAPADAATPAVDLGDLDFALPAGGPGGTPALAAPEPAEDETPSLDFSQVMPILGGAMSPSASPIGEPAIHAPPVVAPAPPSAPEPPPPSNVVAFPVQHEEPAPAPAEPPAVEVEEIPLERRTRRLDDDIDQDLLPIFLEEAQELVPAVGQGLRDWRSNPDNAAAGNALQRTLHTLKGSARMCGAMALGELTHHMESRVENALALKALPPTLFDELEVSYDRMGFLYDRLVNPQAAGTPPPEPEEAPAPAAPAPATAVAAAAAAAPPATPQPPAAQAVAPQAAPPQVVEPATPAHPAAAKPAEQDLAAASRAMLRVRADLIDRLVNEAGEVSIARSRIEGDMRGIKSALFDLTENVNRLRAQLREIEIQAEGQMQSRVALAQEQDKTFDPLEFDRFTRFQEITRMMAESVNDVSTVQQNLLKALGESEIALSAQARLTRALQSNLMRIRMVPFASISERLFRIVRQAAKETDKRAVLDIKGGQVEVDRSVLERITAPFEHMLRNSVAHGVEPSAERVAKGKPELGEIKIEVRQEGNEIVLAVTDDGAGLNYERIRAKAVTQGLLRAEDAPSDAEVAEFIFHPGFSTASEVTQLAGRGVGMDVVKSEIAALGGRVELTSETGRGTKFAIYLPLTLAVTQAVMVRAAGVTFAIPAVMVEQVRQVKADELSTFQTAGEAQWQNRRYPFRYLPRLLGDSDFQPEARRVTPVMFVRTGPSMAAIQLDEIMGSQEIVVKNTGPLLARVAGITGATVLGTGEIVLIINPVILTAREPTVQIRTVEPSGTAAAPAAAAPAVPTVMIVDD
ncbi:MAG: Hpt domain-containing protein, partial [Bacteroidota bacterium]